MSINSLGYLVLGASNRRAWTHYLTESLGLQLGSENCLGEIGFRMDAHEARIYLKQSACDDLMIVGWEVANRHVFDSLYAQIEGEGIVVLKGSEELINARKVVDVFSFTDVDGLDCEVYYGPTLRHEIPFQSPRSISGFKTGENGLGHIALRSFDRDRSSRFYSEIMGFRYSDYISLYPFPEDLVFMHCNSRHHSLAFGNIPSPKRLLHLMVEVNNVDDVMQTYYLVQKSEIRLASDIGRHSNDFMFSFYMESPSGFEIEYGFDGREIDDSVWKVEHHAAGSIWGHKSQASRLEQIQATMEDRTD